MGFFDTLMNTINQEKNTVDPLFGGLIPRRVEPDFAQQVRQSGGSINQPLNRDRLIPQNNTNEWVVNNKHGDPKDIHGGRLDQYNPLKDKNFVFDWTEQKLNLGKNELEHYSKKQEQDYEIDKAKIDLGSRGLDRQDREDRHKANIDYDKQDIEHRKQALEEWKVRNPEGELKAGKDGKLHVIDKRSGKTIDTGLTTDHFDDREKLALQQRHAITLEGIRQKGKETLKGMENRDKLISPTQQRAAEKDAANELLNDPRYSWLAKEGLLEANPDGSLRINEPLKGYYGRTIDDAKGTINTFKEELKSKAQERMGKTIGSGSLSNQLPNAGKTVQMLTETGETIDVPEDEVEEAKAAGAKLPGAVTNTTTKDDTASAIERIMDSGGRIVYAGNVKGRR